MKLQEIEILIQKYFEGETSIQEEKELKDFFVNNEVPEHLAAVKEQFAFFDSETHQVKEVPGMEEKLRIQIQNQAEKEQKTTIRLLPRILTAIAATFLIVFTVMKINESSSIVSENGMTSKIPFEGCTDINKCADEAYTVLLDFSEELNKTKERVNHEEIIP